MKLTYSQKWAIKDKRVYDLDKKRIKLNKLTCQIDSQMIADPQTFVSQTTIKKRRNLAKDIQRSIRDIYNSKKSPEGFDDLILRDINSNTKKILADDDYFYNSSSKINQTIAKYLSAIFGKAAYTKIKDAARPRFFNHDAIDKRYSLIHEMTSKRLDEDMILERTSYSRVRSLFELELDKIKKRVDEFYVELGMIEEKPNYNIELAPVGCGISFWEGHNFLMAIDPAKICCYKNKPQSDEFLFNKSEALVIGIHELGHGLEDKISETMPLGLRQNNSSFNTLCHGLISEGVALETENLYLEWQKMNRKRHKISEFDINLMDFYINSYVDEKIPGILYDLLQQKEIEEDDNPDYPKSFSIIASRKKLAEITGIKRYLKDYFLFDDHEFSETLGEMVYVFGKEHVSNLMKKIRNVLDLRSSAGKKIALCAISSGCWSDKKAQEEFIFDYYLPKAEKDGLIETENKNP